MPAFITKKLSFLLLGGAWLVAIAIVFLLNHALSGPTLGGMYDFLLSMRRPPPISRQILLIDADEVAEPGDVFSVLMTLSELGASDLVIEVPVLGTRPGIAESGEEFTRRVDGEFHLVARNIRSLFDAIRLGLVSPQEAPNYVESLVELSERGRDRLNAAVLRRQEEGEARMSRAAAVFGSVIVAHDLRAHPWVPPEGEIPWYSKPRPDADGTVRRIAPFVPLESLNLYTPAGTTDAEEEESAVAQHIVYRALSRRWTESSLETGRAGTVLVNRFEHSGGSSVFRFPLDGNGNILVERPGRYSGYRRIGIEAFLEYGRADRNMAGLLDEAWNLGLYSETRPERIPAILRERAESVRERLLESPNPEIRASWIAARNDYIESIDEFLYGPSETAIANGYELRIAENGETDDGEIEDLGKRRNEAITAFVAMREAWRELELNRENLRQAAEASFSIMAPLSPGGGDYSALLANALLTGSHITPGRTLYVILWSLVASLLVLAVVGMIGSGATAILGIAGGAVCLAAFSAVFVVFGYWIDPAIPTAAVLGGTLFLSVCRFCIGYGRLLRFHREAEARERWIDFHFGDSGNSGNTIAKR